MTSNYERNENVPPAKIGHYASKPAQPHAADGSAPVDSVEAAKNAHLEVSYEELMITTSIELPEIDEAG